MSAFSQATLLFGQQRALWQLIGANMNSTADQAFTQTFPFSQFFIPSGGIVITQASGALSGAVGGIYTAASKTTPIVSAAQTYVAVTSATSVVNLTPNTLGGSLLSASTLFLSLTTPLGSAGTASIYIWGIALN